MEMEFKDNSRRRTLVLVVGVLLALGGRRCCVHAQQPGH